MIGLIKLPADKIVNNRSIFLQRGMIRSMNNLKMESVRNDALLKMNITDVNKL